MSAGVTPELVALVDKMRYQLTALQGQLTEVKRQLAGLPQADDWRALGEETTEPDTPMRLYFVAVEAALREVALALEEERQAAA